MFTSNDYNEAFKRLELLDESLNEADFNLSSSDEKEIRDFVDDKEDLKGPETVKVIDLDAESEEDVESSNIGKIILQCPCCETVVMKDADEIDLPDDCDDVSDCNVQIGDQCPVCYSEEGYKIVGKVAPYEEITVEITPKDDDSDDDVEEESDIDKEDSEDDEDSDEKNESLTEEVDIPGKYYCDGNGDYVFHPEQKYAMAHEKQLHGVDADESDLEENLDETVGGTLAGAALGVAANKVKHPILSNIPIVGTASNIGAGIKGALVGSGVSNVLAGEGNNVINGAKIGAGVGGVKGAILGGVAGGAYDAIKNKNSSSSASSNNSDNVNPESPTGTYWNNNSANNTSNTSKSSNVLGNLVGNNGNSSAKTNAVKNAALGSLAGAVYNDFKNDGKLNLNGLTKGNGLKSAAIGAGTSALATGLYNDYKNDGKINFNGFSEGLDDSECCDIDCNSSKDINSFDDSNLEFVDNRKEAILHGADDPGFDEYDLVDNYSWSNEENDLEENLDETVGGTLAGAALGVAANKIKHPILSNIPIVGTASNIGAGIKGALVGSGVSNALAGEGSNIANGAKIGAGIGGVKGAALGAIGGAVANDIQNDGKFNLNGLKGNTLDNESLNTEQYLCDSECDANDEYCIDDEYVNEGFVAGAATAGKFILSHWSDFAKMLEAIGVSIDAIKQLKTTLKKEKETPENNESSDNETEQSKNTSSVDVEQHNNKESTKVSEAIDVKIPARKVKALASWTFEHWDDIVNIFKSIGVPIEVINEILKKLKEQKATSVKESLIEREEFDDNQDSYYRGNKDIKFVWNGTQSDPELIYKGKSFNYWFIEEALWDNFIEDSYGQWTVKDAEKPECEDAFNNYVQDYGTSYLDDCIAGGYFESLNEGLNDVQIDTDTDRISIHAEKKNNGDEMIAPLNFQDANEIVDSQDDKPEDTDYLDSVETESQEEEVPEETINDLNATDEEQGEVVDQDVEEVDEEALDNLGESYFNKVYNNVKSYKTEAFYEKGNTIVCEGIITFNSGNKRHTQFILEGNTIDASGNCSMLVENVQITPGKKAFTLHGKLTEGKFIPESMTYNYLAEGVRFRGNVSLTEARPNSLKSGGRWIDYDDDYVDTSDIDYSKLPGTISYAVLKYAKELGRCNWPSEMVEILDKAFEETGVPDTEDNRKFMLSLRQKATEEREDPKMPGRAKNLEDAMHYVFTLYTAGTGKKQRSSTAGIKPKLGTDYTTGDKYDAAHHRFSKKAW